MEALHTPRALVLARPSDRLALVRLYKEAKVYMRAMGNHDQWQGTYPEDRIPQDLAEGRLYAVWEGDRLIGACALYPEGEPAYQQLRGGTWSQEAPYVAVHRLVGSRGTRGLWATVAEAALQTYGYVRVDTHPDNRPFQKALAATGFKLRGEVELPGVGLRLAYDLVAPSASPTHSPHPSKRPAP